MAARPKRGPARAAAGIWISYLLVLIGADYAATRAGAGAGLLPAPYYISQLLIALSVLALSMAPGCRRASARPFSRSSP